MRLVSTTNFEALTLDDGRSASGLSVHELCRGLRVMGLEVSPSSGHFDLLQKLADHRKAEEAAKANKPYSTAEATITAAQARAR